MDPLDLARQLLAAGIPVIAVGPGDRPRQSGWAQLTPEQCDLSRYRPGDALALVGGWGIDVVDVDTKAGAAGSVGNLPPFEHFGVTRTPSGGEHYLVPSSGLGKISPLRTEAGFVGDYVGGSVEGGRLLAFLPGSVRSKYPDGGYVITSDWRIEDCLAAEPDPDLVMALVEAKGSLGHARDVYIDDSERATELHPYAAKAVAGELARLDALSDAGWGGEPWDNTCHKVACNLIEFGNSGWAGYDTAAEDFFDHAPSDESFGRADHERIWSSAERSVSGGGRKPPVTASAGELFNDPPAPVSAAEHVDLDVDPGVFFDKSDLKVRLCAQYVTSLLPVRRAPDHELYVYQDGVWRFGQQPLGGVTTGMFGDRWRSSRHNEVIGFLSKSNSTPELDPGARPDPRYINMLNGLYDWKARQLVPHTPDHPSLVQLQVPWSPEATCPAFDAFLASVLPDDALDFFWELLGYLLYSGNPFQVMPMLFGSGSNGKGTLLDVLTRIIGHTNASAVSLHDLAENRFAPADLYGKLINISGDLDDRWLKNTGVIKQLTGGDSIRAERKNGQPFTFINWSTPVFSLNDPFTTSDSSHGYARRLLVVPFDKLYDGTGRAGLFTESELAGVARHALGSLRTLMKRGDFDRPESVQAATKSFLIEGDSIQAWLDDELMVTGSADDRMHSADLHEAFESYAVRNGLKTMSMRRVVSKLVQQPGISSVRWQTEGTRGRGVVGLRFR